MKKSITKNVRYDKFNNYCVNEQNEDIKETYIKGIKDLNQCLAACARNATKCSAAEFYNKNKKCYHINKGLSGRGKASKGKTGAKRYKDATCYVRG